MNHVLLAIIISGLLPSATEVPTEAAARHCQVPCGIYSDMLRIDLLMEDAATIEKAMTQVAELVKSGDAQSMNQGVRWITTKDAHATNIQEMVSAYWLTQRIKAPKDAADATGRARYLKQLELMHGLTVAAMKCKQTVDPAWPRKVRELGLEFSKTYFSPEDLKHLEEHHGKDHK